MNQVVSDEQERLIEVLRQGVGEAIAKVELGGMTAALAKAAIGFARDAGLLERDGNDREVESLYQSIKRCEYQRILMAIDYDGSFKQRRGGRAPRG